MSSFCGVKKKLFISVSILPTAALVVLAVFVFAEFFRSDNASEESERTHGRNGDAFFVFRGA